MMYLFVALSFSPGPQCALRLLAKIRLAPASSTLIAWSFMVWPRTAQCTLDITSHFVGKQLMNLLL